MPLDHTILDELHLMLKIMDRMTENLITEVMEKDSKKDFNKDYHLCHIKEVC
jgi:hypothetical protein